MMTKKFLSLLLAIVMICAMGTFSVSAAVADTDEAKIGDAGFATLEAAFAAVKDGETIVLLKNVAFNKDRCFTSGEWRDGMRYTGDQSFTVDLNGKTISGDDGATKDASLNDYLIYINNTGNKANEITFVNGTISGGAYLWNVLCVSGSSATHPTVVNLGEGLTITGDGSKNTGEDGVIKVRSSSVVNVLEGAKVVSTAAMYGVQAAASTATVNIYDGATILHGVDAPISSGIAVTGTGTCNIYGGTIQSGSVAVQPSSSGKPSITISGGEITAPTAVVSASDVNSYPSASSSVTISGGVIEGNVTAMLYGSSSTSDGAKLEISGGTVTGNVTANADTSVSISGGTVTGNVDTKAGASTEIKGGTVGNLTVAAGADTTIEGGIITGTLNVTNQEDITVTGGTFNDESAKDLVADLIGNNNSNGDFEMQDSVVRQKFTATFMADGATVDTVTFYNGDTKLSSVPAVPEKKGYVGYWASYELENKDIVINAVYVKYETRLRVSFVVEGKLRAIIQYRVGQEELTVVPKVPEKEGYIGAWESYTLNGKNMIVRAVYTPIAE